MQELSPDSPEDGWRWEGTQAVHSLKRNKENVASIPSSTLWKYSILMGMAWRKVAVGLGQGLLNIA